MRIKSKLLSGYFIMAALTLLVGFSALQTIRIIRTDFDAVTGHVLPHVQALEALRFAGQRVVSSAGELGFLAKLHTAGSGGDGFAHEERQLLVEGYQGYEDAKAHLLTFDLDGVPEEAAARASALEAGDRLIATGRQLVDLIKAGTDSLALYPVLIVFEKAEIAFLDAINQAIALEQRSLDAHRADVTRSIYSALATTLVVTLIAVCAALAIGLRLAADISNPVIQLKRWAERLGDGAPGLRIVPRSRDEIGDLAQTFNQMAGRVEKAQEESNGARNYLTGIIRTLTDALFVLTPSGIIRSSNPAATRLLGRSEEELAGLPFSDLLVDRAQLEELAVTFSDPSRETPLELLLRHSSGETVPVALSSAGMETAGEGGGEVVCIVRNLTAHREAEATIRQLAYFDPLTDLPNRALLGDRLNQALARAQRENALLALIHLDLDRFKDINDTLGHACGDLYLQTVAQRLAGCIRKSDTLARFGGDEFVILLGGPKDQRNVTFVVEHLRAILAPPISLGGQEVFPSASMGIALYPYDGESPDALLKHADMAMSVAKQRGRNTYQYFSADMHQRAMERRDLEAKLRRALQNEEFFLVYQPQIDLGSGRVFGVEALLRWRHPEDGMISPARFIPVAEETGLIRPLGEWVLRTACAQNQAWQAAGHPPLQTAVNFSGRQVDQPGIPALVAQILRETGLPPSRLELELTESSLMENAEATITTLIELKALGVQLSVDDFGTGYSSLSYLKHFPIDRLKVDQSFTRDIEADPDDRSIIRAIIGLGHSLGLRVIAEGVETTGALAMLQEFGCDEAQGYYFAKPLEAAALIEFLARRTPPAPPGAPRDQLVATA